MKINEECRNLVYNDITPCFNLIKSIKQESWYNELSLFTTVFFTIYDYLPSEDIGFVRYITYFSYKWKQLSIKTISENGAAFCSEKSGMVYNMFKFL